MRIQYACVYHYNGVHNKYCVALRIILYLYMRWIITHQKSKECLREQPNNGHSILRSLSRYIVLHLIISRVLLFSRFQFLNDRRDHMSRERSPSQVYVAGRVAWTRLPSAALKRGPCTFTSFKQLVRYSSFFFFSYKFVKI